MQPTTKDLSSKAALTLVEVLIGLTLFAILSLSLFRLADVAIRGVESSEDSVRATQIIQYQIETMRAQSWDDLADLVGKTTLKLDKNGLPTTGSAKIPFNWQSVDFRRQLVAEETDLYSAEFILDWTDRRGMSRTQSYFTYFTKNGLNEFYMRTTN